MNRSIPTFACVLVLLAAGLGSGCTMVKPWERGTLADPTMNRSRDPVGITLTEHVFFSREGTTGGTGVGGGGCGCN